jgi:hypothetical protein
MRARLTLRELRHMANESVIVTEAKRDRQSRTQGEGVGPRQPIGSGRRVSTPRIFFCCAEPSVCYEVIRIRQRQGFQIGGRFVEAAELYPRSEAWGTDGFTLTDKDAAFVKLREKITERTTS